MPDVRVDVDAETADALETECDLLGFDGPEAYLAWIVENRAAIEQGTESARLLSAYRERLLALERRLEAAGIDPAAVDPETAAEAEADDDQGPDARGHSETATEDSTSAPETDAESSTEPAGREADGAPEPCARAAETDGEATETANLDDFGTDGPLAGGSVTTVRRPADSVGADAGTSDSVGADPGSAEAPASATVASTPCTDRADSSTSSTDEDAPPTLVAGTDGRTATVDRLGPAGDDAESAATDVRDEPRSADVDGAAAADAGEPDDSIAADSPDADGATDVVNGASAAAADDSTADAAADDSTAVGSDTRADAGITSMHLRPERVQRINEDPVARDAGQLADVTTQRVDEFSRRAVAETRRRLDRDVETGLDYDSSTAMSTDVRPGEDLADLDAIDVPGRSDERVAERRAVVGRALAFLRDCGRARRSEFVAELYEDNPAGYETADGWWRCVREGLSQVDAVEGGHVWEYVG